MPNQSANLYENVNSSANSGLYQNGQMRAQLEITFTSYVHTYMQIITIFSLHCLKSNKL